MTDPAELYEAVADETGRVLVGNDEAVELLTIALLTGGHVILEGVPGVAKTTIARLFARTIDLEYNRIQMMPDVLPADVTGTHVYRETTGEFELQRGPVFANVVMVDEINRATPKTQSALLEAMQEQQVTIEGDTHNLPTPFLVVATQNPIEMEGTFELPKAQRDRFQFKLTVDIPDREEERAILDRFDRDHDLSPDDVEPVVSVRELQSAADTVRDVHVAESVREYVLDVVAATRESSQVAYGASPRATLAFLHASKARAAIHGRDYVIPDDVKALAEPVLVHRLVLETDTELADVSPAGVVGDVMDDVEPPGGEAAVELADRASTDATD
ncbi:AAA family ATPase [Halorussus caseinilyticus]|uniref:AAA family ATPase n=1 Tax=Halorussus caseinilyticus TaxID=3034025 RepID=A0ABD5WIV9_9EURY|nr:MoxR family ATPase [Halorussus sp. DT72]